MKTRLVASVLLLLSVSLRAQKIKQARSLNHPVKTILCGKGAKDLAKFYCGYLDLNTWNYQTNDSTWKYIQDTVINGVFSIKLYLNNPVKITTIGLSKSLLLEPGDSICMDLSSGYGLRAIFTGKGAEKWQCIQAMPSKVHSNDDLTYLLWPDSILMNALTVINKYQPVISKVAYTVLKADYIAEFVTAAGLYYLNRSVNDDNEKVISWKSYWIDFFNKYINKGDALLASSGDIEDAFITKILLQYAIDKNLSFKMVKYNILPSERYKILCEGLGGVNIRDRVLTRFLNEQLLSYSFTDVKASIEDFFNHNPSTKKIYTVALEQKYESYKNRLNQGQPAYAFALPDTSGKIVKMRDFRGKVVLLDFMFTGCGGCMQLVPYLNKVEKYFKDRNDIVFVSVSTDKDVEQFKASHRKGIYSVPGSLPLYTKGKQYWDIINFYEPLFPTLTLIDQNGRLVANRAPDPRIDDGKALIELIEKTLVNKGLTKEEF